MTETVVFLLVAVALITGAIWLFKDSIQLFVPRRDEKVEKPNRQKNWEEEDTTVAVFIATFGVEHLGLSMESVAATLGRSEGSLEAKVNRIEHVNTDHTVSDLSLEVLEKYRGLPMSEFKSIVLNILENL